jgi:hypothetical protein
MATMNLRNPTGYDGSPGTKYRQGVLRLATDEEAAAGIANNVAITPAQVQSTTSLDFASPPVLGFGSTTPRPVHATTLDSTGLTSLATGAGAVLNLGNTTGTIGFYGVAAVAKPTSTTDLRAALINLGLYTTGGASPLNLNGGAFSSGTAATTTTFVAGTTITATLGNITATNGNLVASTSGTGILLTSPQASGAATSPLVVNGRSGRATFTSVSIAAAADLTLTITNSSITSANTEVMLSMSGATTGSALSIKSKTASAGSLAIVVTNGTLATTTTADIQIDFLVLNA